jgi:hypothetical protein
VGNGLPPSFFAPDLFLVQSFEFQVQGFEFAISIELVLIGYCLSFLPLCLRHFPSRWEKFQNMIALTELFY